MAKQAKQTFASLAKKRKCAITLSSLRLNTKMLDDGLRLDPDTFYSLVFETPTNQGLYGDKFSQFKGLKKGTSDQFVKEIASELGIEENDVLTFGVFDGKAKKAITSSTLKAKGERPFLLYKVENGIYGSLFASIRNCLAHGDIIKNGKWYYLFCLSSGNRKTSDENKKIKFLLKIENPKVLKAFRNVLNRYRG